MSYVPFIEVTKATFDENFHPLYLIGADPDKKKAASKAVHRVAKIMAKENKKRIASNMDHVIKKSDDGDIKESFLFVGKNIAILVTLD